MAVFAELERSTLLCFCFFEKDPEHEKLFGT